MPTPALDCAGCFATKNEGADCADAILAVAAAFGLG